VQFIFTGWAQVFSDFGKNFQAQEIRITNSSLNARTKVNEPCDFFRAP